LNVGVAAGASSPLDELEELEELLELLVVEPELDVVEPELDVTLPELVEVWVTPLEAPVSSSPPQAMPAAAAPTTSAASPTTRKLSFILMPIVVLPLHATVHGAFRPHWDKR